MLKYNWECIWIKVHFQQLLNILYVFMIEKKDIPNLYDPSTTPTIEILAMLRKNPKKACRDPYPNRAISIQDQRHIVHAGETSIQEVKNEIFLIAQSKLTVLVGMIIKPQKMPSMDIHMEMNASRNKDVLPTDNEGNTNASDWHSHFVDDIMVSPDPTMHTSETSERSSRMSLDA